MTPVILILFLVAAHSGFSFELNGNITGSGNLTKTDPPYTITPNASLELNSNLTGSGNLTKTDPPYAVTPNASFELNGNITGSGNLTKTDPPYAVTPNASFELNGNITGSGNLTKTDPPYAVTPNASFELNGNITGSGNLTTTDPPYAVTPNASFQLNGNITGSGNLTKTDPPYAVTPNASFELNGNITGSGNLTKTDPPYAVTPNASFELNGNITGSGNLTKTDPPYAVTPNASFELNGNITGSGNLTKTDPPYAVTPNASFELNGNITGSGNLTKTDPPYAVTPNASFELNGNITGSGNLTTTDPPYAVTPNASFQLNGNITGSGNLTKTDPPYAVTLNASSELNGNITGTRNLTKTDSPYTVTSNVVVTKGAVLNVDPGVEMRFAPGVGLKVHGTLKAQGNSTSRITFTDLKLNKTVDLDKLNGSIPYNKGFRLSGGANYRTGRLEVLVDNQWTSVCYQYYHYWTTLNSQVACRMLGFVGAKRAYYLRREATKPLNRRFNCKGTEKSLFDCPNWRHSCYYYDVGVECYTLLPLLAERVYWSGIEYEDTATKDQLRYVDIHKAFIGIHGHKLLPPLYNVTLTYTIKGIKSMELKNGFYMHDTVIVNSMIRGIDISSKNETLNINNSIVSNTTSGDGIEFSSIRTTQIDLSDVDPSNVSFPLYLTVSSKYWETEDTIKVFKTSPGQFLALHFQSLSGQGYYIEGRDGDNINCTLLTRATQRDSGQIASPGFTTGNVMWIRYRHYQRYAAAKLELLITESRDKSSLSIINSKVIGNNGFGLALKDVTNQIYLENTDFSFNSKDGMMAENITGTVSGSNLRFNQNVGNGVAFYHSSINIYHFSDITAFGNQGKGIMFQISWINCSISHASLLQNIHQGLLSSKVSGSLNLGFLNISDNHLSGIEIDDGAASVSIYSSFLLQNWNHGLKLRNQGGDHKVVDSFIKRNKQHGMYMHEIQSSINSIPLKLQFTGVDITGSEVSNNLYNGIYLSPACQHIGGSTENVSVLITHSNINNNSRGGFRFTEESCSHGSRYKQVSLIVSHSELRENKNQAFYASCIAHYRLKAKIWNNTFYNNSGQVIVISDQNTYYCAPKSISNPVEVSMNQNQFLGNHGSNLMYIDFMGFPSIRKASVEKNTFQNNSVNLLFPNLFQRTTDRALIVFKEGSFTVHNNSFDANDCRYLLSTMYVNHSSIIDARLNWWNTKDECQIKDKIFDFYDRVQLAKVKYFPYFLSSNNTNLAIKGLPHMSCFLQNNTIGGALDGELSLPSSLMPYKVRDDIVVLENGSLWIPSNTTLMFPDRAAMLVQGELHVTGTIQEKVKFIRNIRNENDIRLHGGQGPWEGVLEFFYNSTWIPLCYGSLSVNAKRVCRHLGYFEHYASYRYVSRNPTDDFVFNIKCLDSDEIDVIQCNKKKWTFGKNCYRVSAVYCRREYWAGIHLAFSNRKSELHHLNINDAGFNYRSDISVPGFALRIDYHHHNLSNININSSSGIGIQNLFPSPFSKKSLVPYSKISHTSSIGLMFGSPYVRISNVEVESTRGAGFQLRSQWDVSINRHMTETMSPGVKKIDDICYQNITYLKEEDIVYLYTELPYGTSVTCQHRFVTERGRRLGIQVLQSHLPRYNQLHAFDGSNITSGKLWKIETFDIQDRRAFNSLDNEVILKLEKRYYSISFRLVVFSIKDVKAFESFVEIENSKFNLIRGINIYGNVIGQLKMINCSMSNSSDYLRIDSKEVTMGIIRSITLETNSYGIHLRYTKGNFGIYNSNIFKTRNYGLDLYIYSAGYYNNNNKTVFNLLNCTFEQNKASAVNLNAYARSAQQNVFLTFKWNSFKQNQGVTMSMHHCSRNTESWISENRFENNIGSVITATSCSYLNNIVMRRNIFWANQCTTRAVITVQSRMHGLEASYNLFQSNQGVILSFYLDYHYKPLKIIFNIFKNNTHSGKSTIDIKRVNSQVELVINDNIFERNIGMAILSTGTSSYCYSPLQLRRNVFRYNVCTKKSVLWVRKQYKDFEASGNDFDSNLGATLIFEGIHNMANLLFANNYLENNTCISREMVSILRMDGNFDARNNTFHRNKASGIMSVQSLHNVDFVQGKKSFKIINNTFTENEVAADVLSRAYFTIHCVLKFRGFLYYKITGFFHNKLVNPSFEKEFCLRIPALAQKDTLNASHNWWGTSDNYHVRQRIGDFDDNHDYAIALTSPFLTSYNDIDYKTPPIVKNVTGLRRNKLGGRVDKSLTLTEEASPYKVTSDLTILSDVILTIEPKVELRLSPGVSLLVLGTLIARGTKERKIKFTLDNPNGNQSVRLKDGHFPWEGRLEVYHQNKWMPVCCPDSTWNPANTKVICRELGYLPHQESHYTKFAFEGNEYWPYRLHCHGNESLVSSCDAKDYAFGSNTTHFVGLDCKGKPWGNIGFVGSNENGTVMEKSVLEHVDIRHCGQHFNTNVSAIESVMRTPIISHVTIQNCTFQGFSYFLASDNITATKCELKHLQGNGVSVIQSSYGVTIKDSLIESTINGFVIDATRQHNIPAVYYGRSSICDSSIKTFAIQNKIIVFFELNDIDTEQLSTIPHINCEKDFKAQTEGKGVRIKLLFYQGSQTMYIYDKRRTSQFQHHYSGSSLKTMLLKDLIFPEIGKIKWYGNPKSKVLFEVDVVDIQNSDIPCNFQYGMCGWQSFRNMSFNGINMTATWTASRDHHPGYWGSYYRPDNSFNSNEGYVVRIGYSDWDYRSSRNASLVSPLLTSQAKYCNLVFYYKFGRGGASYLNVFLQKGAKNFDSFSNSNLTLLWKPNSTEVLQWKKAVLALPKNYLEFRIIFFGSYAATSSWYSRNFVLLDDIEIQKCRNEKDEVENNLIRNNEKHGIWYNSTSSNPLSLKRNKFVKNGNSTILKHQDLSGAVYAEIKDKDFLFLNNHVAGNAMGGLYVQTENNDGHFIEGRTSRKKSSWIYGNTFVQNGKEALHLVSRKGVAAFVHIKENYFSSNYGRGISNSKHSIVKIKDVPTKIEGNFFFNNSGLVIMQYEFSNKKYEGQHCINNTFFLNTGTATEYGTTIRTNGPIQYHGNSLKNPSNLYEIDTTASAVMDPVNATKNWFGFGVKPTVKARLRDKDINNHLPKVLFEPFVKIQPKNILSLGCPPEWMNMGPSCYVFRAGVQSFQEADEYCKYYGGHIISSSSPADKELLAKIMARIAPTYDQPKSIPLWVISNGVREKDDDCQVLSHEGNIQQVPCDSHYSFACSRNAVIRCPNGCSHNGDCIGSMCFCYRGWTGEDCSKHHCQHVHNCSEVGECIGPNNCKCTRSFQGRACTYSYCSKFRNCSTCVSDQYCGWCDKIRQCLPGNEFKPHKKSCSDWFYYNCYTVGSENHCSDNIRQVNCQLKQCNFARNLSNMQSCAKCRDLEKCYNLKEAGKCRAWNASRCPHGMLQVDYSDKSRINNTRLRSNVKVVDPNKHTIYNCPVLLTGKDDVSSVFVVPKIIGIEVGHVITSPQAGGIMHKINQTNQKGPYTIALGERAEVEDVIEYADFETEVRPKPIADEVTEEEEEDEEQINGMINGDILLNDTIVHVIPQDNYIYKCVGHLYQIGSKSVVSHYLVMDVGSSINAHPGDVIVARESHGFIERVTNISKTENLTFIHTMLERCDGNSTWTKKFKPRRSGSEEDDDIMCTGGNNNPGLLISDSEDEISVNESLIGRRSQPFISKVISSSVNGDYVIIEVLPVTSVNNGTAETQVQIDQLHAKHRRAKREVDVIIDKEFPFKKSRSREKTHKFAIGSYLKTKVSFFVSATFTIKCRVFKERNAENEMEMTDIVLGMDMLGKLSSSMKVTLGIKKKFSKSGSIPIVRPIQIGTTICIPIYLVCIPSAFFLEMNLNYDITAKVHTYVPLEYTLTSELFMGGTCSYKHGCTQKSSQKGLSIVPLASVGEIKTDGKVTLSGNVEPKLSYKLPVIPKFVRNIVNFVKKIFPKLFKRTSRTDRSNKQTDISIIRLSVAVPFQTKIIISPCSTSSGKDNNGNIELTVDQNYGATSLIGELSVGLGHFTKSFTLFNRQVYAGISKRFCLLAAFRKDECQCPTTSPPTSMSTPKAVLSTNPPPASKSAPATTPSTTPPPCECMEGQRGVPSNDKDGECNCLPVCKGRKAPVKINDLYVCPEHPPCGNSPNCVTGRKGRSCSQPDFDSCTSECSGNGIPFTSECRAVCRCSRGWMGQCCDIRRPARGFGDPHLETLDGIEFDYFGIGEFWGCHSIYNSFGLQFRFFAHKGTSLIGGIALKAGRSVVSVMSLITSNPTDMPHLRIDGLLVNLTTAWGKQISIDNKTAFLEVQKPSDVKNAGELVFFSLEYKTGVTVTIYVRHSSTMGRQLINVLYTLTAEFKGHTLGICGLMDNNPANDLTGPNGELYPDPVKFADSWRISSTHNGSGTYDSWSWNSSNFHVDDVMDSTYTDPSHVPMYGLSNVPSNLLEKSRQICLARELPDNLLKSCIYDVALTNDTSFAMQETLLTGCPDQCSGKGRCINQTCECLEGWSGEKCEIGSCPNCSKNGKCIKGFCQCNIGWGGETCSEKATCYDVNNCTSPVHGICKTTNNCFCNDGYMGRDCSIIPTCLNVSSCSGHGKCVDYDVCKCDKDWTGKNCSKYSCSDLDYCSGHGQCVNVYQCKCNAGWTGISCAIPDCPVVNQCSGNGTCVAPNECQCYPGYSGNACLDTADCSMLANCSNHGACLTGDANNSSCRCYDGYQGVDCSQPTCHELNNCSNRGICKEAGFCECDDGFSGSDCSNVSCQALNYCSDHGECIDYDVCKCEPSWHGAACSIPDCTALSDCSNKGVCLAPNKCECYPGYDGIKCDKLATPNIYPPVFSSAVYNVSVHENATLGTFVGQVNASDLDQGRNGEVMYLLSNNDVGGIFTVEGGSGRIFTSSSLRYDTLKKDFVILDVNALDNGKPTKIASCKVYIKIIDINDNCPIFDQFLQKSYNISVNTTIGTVVANVTAVDKDNGDNGDVRYHFANENGTFSIDMLTGTIRVMYRVQPMSYHVVVSARDQGTPSCSTSMKMVFHAHALQKETTEQTTTEGSTLHEVTTTDSVTSSQPLTNILSSTSNSRLEKAFVIAGCTIGVCLLAAIFAIVVLKKIRLDKAKKVVPENKRNASPRESLEGDIPDFKDIRGIEMQVWASRCPSTKPLDA